MCMRRARAERSGEHATRVADVFTGPLASAEQLSNFLDEPALAVVRGCTGNSCCQNEHSWPQGECFGLQ